jgi:hypothetical protein
MADPPSFVKLINQISFLTIVEPVSARSAKTPRLDITLMEPPHGIDKQRKTP